LIVHCEIAPWMESWWKDLRGTIPNASDVTISNIAVYYLKKIGGPSMGRLLLRAFFMLATFPSSKGDSVGWWSEIGLEDVVKDVPIFEWVKIKVPL
jgi:hypothetical protein